MMIETILMKSNSANEPLLRKAITRINEEACRGNFHVVLRSNTITRDQYHWLCNKIRNMKLIVVESPLNHRILVSWDDRPMNRAERIWNHIVRMSHFI
jgi:hypothetical protein